MCGIVGVYDKNIRNKYDVEKEIKMMMSCLAHRGPDESGTFVSERVALGHQRLSIIDLTTGRQPIFNEKKTMCITYNGEVYNYRELKKELIVLGHSFSTNSDTETILHAYEEWGEECVERLRGMFAFGIWDSKKQILFLARDRLGIKPLFYSFRNGKLVFASEIKSILVDSNFTRNINNEALAAYFMFSYIPSPKTVYDNINKLPAGHYLICKDGRLTEKKYWDLTFKPDRKKKEQDFIHEFMDLFRESVGLRLISDVPLGAFLSGGIDSSAIVAMMSGQSSYPVNSYTIGFGGNVGSFDDERK
ncbi:MAG: asparagine synthase (glutamine-hydrolyzing), partial [Candidatus Zixiibacteriota bacterium]